MGVRTPRKILLEAEALDHGQAVHLRLAIRQKFLQQRRVLLEQLGLLLRNLAGWVSGLVG